MNKEEMAWKTWRSVGTGISDEVNRIFRKNEEMGDLALWSRNIISEVRILRIEKLE